jgi:hypothetical protein
MVFGSFADHGTSPELANGIGEGLRRLLREVVSDAADRDSALAQLASDPRLNARSGGKTHAPTVDVLWDGRRPIG